MAKTNPIRELFRQNIKTVLGKEIEDLTEEEIPAYIRKAEVEYKIEIIQSLLQMIQGNIEKL
jgi:hypothetical protein